MSKRLFFLPLFLLMGCNEISQKPAPDGYEFSNPEWQKEKVTITLYAYPNQKEFRAAANNRSLEDNVVAFAIIRPPFDECDIHVVHPSVKYSPELAGHELYHCFFGQWHD